MVLELIFATAFVSSDGIGVTLSAQRWMQEYWKPINSLGYRDYEHKWKDKSLFVVGDSIIAGYGIEDISDRLSSVLAKRLGPTWTVAVLAQNGWNPVNEYDALVHHPEKPDWIIVSYFLNDIESAAATAWPLLFKEPKLIPWVLVDSSFTLNYIYWRIYRGSFGNTYWKDIDRAYNDRRTWRTHKLELLKFVNYARNNNAKIAFIVWPYLLDVNGSLKYTDKVADFLRGKGVKVLDLGQYFKGRRPASLVANSMDAHPNASVDAEVGKLIYERLMSPQDRDLSELASTHRR